MQRAAAEGLGPATLSRHARGLGRGRCQQSRGWDGGGSRFLQRGCETEIGRRPLPLAARRRRGALSVHAAEGGAWGQCAVCPPKSPPVPSSWACLSSVGLGEFVITNQAASFLL